MKKLCIFLIGVLMTIGNTQSQEISFKYGKVSNDELSMTVYSKDTTAGAVVLYEDGYATYDYSQSIGFQIQFELKKKIKILKQEGVNEATITIPYYSKSPSDREAITSIEAIAYNLENGKVVKTKMEKKYIFDEEINSRYRRLKFSIPSVKVGTVIEFKYKKTSGHIFDLPDWYVQSDMPVMNSCYEVKVPEYFTFNMDTKGYEHINVVETPENMQFNLGYDSNGANTVSCLARGLKFTAKDIPALKDESNVWCVQDYMAGVRFEIKGTKFPNSFYKDYSQTWDDLEKTLKDDSDFGSNMKMSNPYKEEIKALVSKITDEKEKIEAIYAFVRSRIRWDESYSFYGNKAKDAVKNGTGDNGQINMILLSALKTAGIKAYPVLISRRSNGRIPYTYPSLDKLNTFIVAAQTADEKIYYMDGSAILGGLNMLPTGLLVDRGRVFEPTATEKWVDLTNLNKNKKTTSLRVQLNKEGSMTGEQNTIYTNQMAYSYKASFQAAKDSTEFIEKFQSANQLTVDSCKIAGKEPMSNTVMEQLKFTKTIETAGDFIYINPMIFAHIKENNFTQSDRKLPVEFDYPYSYLLSCTLTIPENYRVEELPKSLKILMDENKGKCIYQITQEGNMIQMNYRFEMNQVLFPQSEYSGLRDFFGQVATKNGEMIVLKKI